MPTYEIQVLNSDFCSSNPVELPDVEEARKQALRGALAIGLEEVCKGNPFFGAEVSVRLDGEMHERFIVTVGHSPLK